MKDLYLIKYEPDGEGAPYFFDLDWVPDLPTFHYPSENPAHGTLSAHYRAIANIPKICADWLPDHFLASKEFLEVCDSLECSYISRPVEVVIQGKAIQKKYFFFAVTERLRAMDAERSLFVLDSNVKVDVSNSSAPNYERIEKLVISEGIDSNLFYFEEINEIVCSARFLAECIKKNIYGIEFKKIDQYYKYAPWDDF
ncbi:Imm43 family immunity protein [Pseudomonas sp. Irchel s3h17]|uniref:Imm43 family immunity protein n=1 Tax=Pseudomonas sp. Irchel s3h17 TaxID=2009182 RepID=UPI000BA4E2C1|nr:DUF1629 domain-containing protein [Pseudomonas sp. Irchel s3h17]